MSKLHVAVVLASLLIGCGFANAQTNQPAPEHVSRKAAEDGVLPVPVRSDVRQQGKEMTLARECFWLWGHAAGSHNQGWNLPGVSRIGPAEATSYMGISNVVMVRYGQRRLQTDAQDLAPFRGLSRTVWSVVGDSGRHEGDDVERALDVARLLPNTDGVMMDDFFRRNQQHVGVLSVAELQELRHRLTGAVRPLELWVVLYDNQLDLPVASHLALCDKVTFWTWEAESLAKLKANFTRFEELVPDARRRILGCYMWDYGQKRPMPVELMKKQCELGLRLLKEHRIVGMIFLASCVCDLDLEAVEWTRQWIKEVGNQEIY